MSKRYVYSFTGAYGLGRELLGGKGFGLADMVALGLPVPPGFTITTQVCNEYYQNDKAKKT